MKDLHCPSCGTPFVRVTHRSGILEQWLTRLNLFPFRCQLCTNQFRAFYPTAKNATQSFDRRQYRRLPTSFPAVCAVDEPRTSAVVTDISMGGCTLKAEAPFARGTFLYLNLEPPDEDVPIRVETAVVCSVRSSSMGIRFLEYHPPDKPRLSHYILSLLISQTSSPRA